MTKMETLSAVIILSVAVATPVFAQGATSHNENMRKIHNSYNQAPGYDTAPRASDDRFSESYESGRAHPGDRPYFNTPGN